MDAMIRLASGKISILRIWELEYNAKKGMLCSKEEPEKTSPYARSLAETYLDNFLKLLETICIGTCGKHEFILTAELTRQTESNIDKTVGYPNLTEADILKYDRPELIVPAEMALRWFFDQLNIADYSVSFDNDSKVFNFSLINHPHRQDRKIPLWYVVKKKWETGECFSKTLIDIVGDMCA